LRLAGKILVLVKLIALTIYAKADLLRPRPRPRTNITGRHTHLKKYMKLKYCVGQSSISNRILRPPTANVLERFWLHLALLNVYYRNSCTAANADVDDN